MSDDGRRESSEIGGEDDKTEAQLRLEAEKRKRDERDEAEWKEYEETRKIERQKLQEEIEELRSRRELRKQERAEEEKRLAEQRQIEDQKRRAEDEERQKRRREEEAHKREERAKKRLENEELSKNLNRPNFVITKKDSGELVPENSQEKKGPPPKTKEQLEAEKRAALEQRIQPLNTSGFNQNQLIEKAKELHSLIYKLESDKYDMSQQYQRQNIDLAELSERARQMNKGGGGKKVNMTQNDATTGPKSRAPPKIAMYSQYERVKDPRSFDERQTVFVGSMYAHEYVRIYPENLVEMGDQGAFVAGPAPNAGATPEVAAA